MLITLSGEISLNPGHFSNTQLFTQEEWQAFSNRELHLIHLNINHLVLKIEELRHTVQKNKSCILESKLDSTVLDPEIYIEILCFNRNQHAGGVTCYIRSNINYKLNTFLPNEIKN